MIIHYHDIIVVSIDSINYFKIYSCQLIVLNKSGKLCINFILLQLICISTCNLYNKWTIHVHVQESVLSFLEIDTQGWSHILYFQGITLWVEINLYKLKYMNKTQFWLNITWRINKIDHDLPLNFSRIWFFSNECN